MHINRVELHSSNLAGVKVFYHQLLGFRMKDESATSVSFSIGRSVLTFVANEDPAFYHIAFLIPSNQFEQALRWLAAKTTVLPFSEQSVIAHFKNWNAQAFYFHDPGGNILEFIAHYGLQNQTDAPFSAASVIGICELGIPVHSVPDACNYFHQQLQVPYYKKGPRLPEFAVMGDEEGLLIVTTQGRGWLPTQRPAEAHPFRAQLTHEGKTVTLTEVDLPQ